jgi:type II secretory pathway component GspD/PulD (secretin)
MRLTLCQSDRQALESIYRAIEQTAQPARLPALASNASNLPGAPKGVTPPGGSRQQGVNTPRSPGAVASGNPQSAIRNPQSTDAGKLQAQRLLAEARNLQRAGRLVEARAKVLEARRYNVLFRADEDNPNLAYRDLAIQASKQIEGILDRASQEVAYGFGDAASRYQKAEHKLLEARQLANHFGLDPRPVEQKLAWVTQLRRGGPAQMAGIPPVAPPQARPTSPGLLLLEKARLELRKNQLATARQMAVDAYNGHYGVENDALAMIRSIEVEEAKQRCLEVCRAFDAAYNAYTRRHDYEQASIIFRGLNPQMLDPVRRDKLKELLMTPELRLASHSDRGEGRGTRSEGQEARSDSPSSPVSPLAPHPSPLSSDGAGHARASDTNLEASLLERTRALREVNFQRWRKQSLDIQKQSAEKFRAGQTEEALNQLTDLLAQLDAQSDKLEVGQLTLLKRPVEARLNGFRSLASQQELQRGASDAHDRFLRENEQIRTNEENKQKTMSQLMKQFNELYREGKYVEAEAIAMRGKELDPDNGVATAAVHMARMQRNRKEYADIKDGKAEMFRQSANWAETQGPFTADVYVDPDSAARSRGRKPLGPIQVGHLNDREMGIERKLMSTISPLNLKDVPLRDVINDLRAYHHLNIWIDEPALGEASISLDSPISGNLENISLKSALNLILHNAHLTYQVKDEALQITTVEKAAGQLKTVTYAVADLVIPVPNFCDIQHPIAPELQGHSDSAGPAGEMAPTPTPVPLGLPSGTATGTSLGGQGGSNFATAQSGGVVAVRNDGPTQQESLIKLITSSIKPQSWQDMGGKGTIDYHPLTMALIINQTPDIQEQVAELLAALRRLQDQEVAVEVRFITIAEDFFERIGVNFNMNIVNQSGTSRFQPQITSGQFTPAGYINEFAPKDFLAGLTPAGTFTSNLDIPITTNTFTQSIPPFGGYPGVPGFGGITLGLGFLSDIQVFLFLEAVQGDVRTNVMQAPKLTMFNGQTATLFVGDYQYFTTAVTITPNRGQFTYSPNAIARPLGVFLSMQPVISADRRFVRMSINPSLTNLSTPNIELFPVVVPIFPLFDGTATGQPVVFTQFLQQPVITSIFVQTTVVVPDGGTVLMGGLKRLSEGRREYGPPILSKLPFINRLFKNVGYGRDVHSLLLMVTPRIIIQEEEEFRATGYVAPSNVIER